MKLAVMESNTDSTRMSFISTAILRLLPLDAFLLTLREGFFIKPFDALTILIGILALSDRGIRHFIRKQAAVFAPYVKIFLLLVLCIVLAQAITYFRYGENPLNPATLKNFAGLLFNIGACLLIALLIYYYKEKIFVPISVSIFLSPLTALPAYFGMCDSICLSGNRMAAFLQNPIIWSAWGIVAFLAGLGLFLTAKNFAQRTLITAWLVVIADLILWGGSRAAWLSLTVGIIFWLWIYWRAKDFASLKRLIVICLFVFAAGSFLFTYTTPATLPPSIFLKIKNFITNPLQHQLQTTFWPPALRTFMENPLGLGFPTKSSTYATYPLTTNTFLEIAIAGGAAALVLFIVLLQRIARAAAGILKNSGRSAYRHLELAWIVLVAAILADIFFTDGFLFRIFWFLLALIIGLIWIKSDNSAPKTSF